MRLLPGVAVTCGHILVTRVGGTRGSLHGRSSGSSLAIDFATCPDWRSWRIQMVSDTKYVYDFAEGNRDLKDLLGGKGANLAEMTNLGLPVPPGFVITTEACREYLAKGSAPAELSAQVSDHLALLEKTMGK